MWQQLLDILFPPRGRRKVAREVSLATLPIAIHATHTRSGAVVNACVPYTNTSVRALIHALKFDASPHAHNLCVRVLADALSEHVAEQHAFGNRVYITTVPASATRATQRGHTHLEPLAQAVCVHSGTQYVPLLRRTRDTKRQMGLPATQRLHNMHKAFTCTQKQAEPNTHVIVLDDVVTTGGTLHEAARALRSVGYKNVSLWAIAHA